MSNRSKKNSTSTCEGDYPAVIEIDDYINHKYIESLVRRLEETNTNICNPRYVVQIDHSLLKYMTFYSAKHDEIAHYLSEEKSTLLTVNVTHCKLYRRNYYHLSEKYFKINEDLCTTYQNCALTEKISFSNDAIYHYMPNQFGLVNQKLSGYGVNKIKNFMMPLEELKQNFLKSNLYETYQSELDAIFIKNYMEHLTDLILRVNELEIKKNLFSILISILNQSVPNWQTNKYYLEKLKMIELTDFFRTQVSQLFMKCYHTKIIEDSVESLLEQYEE